MRNEGKKDRAPARDPDLVGSVTPKVGPEHSFRFRHVLTHVEYDSDKWKE
jgi:hypothetical protein